MQHLIKSKDYVWALFVGHLVLEKILKAIFVKVNRIHPPMIHDLLRLFEKCKINLSVEQQNSLDIISKFNIKARYDNYLTEFYKICTPQYVNEWNSKIKGLRVWLKKKL